MVTGALRLYRQSTDITGRVPAESVRITETAGESNAVMTFDVEYPTGSPIGESYAWADALSSDIELRDSTGRRYFKGNSVNVRRRHMSASGAAFTVTCLGYESWLDRFQLPKWVSKRANGTNITTDREMVQSVATAANGLPSGNFAFDAINTYVANTNASMPVVKVDNGGSVRDVLRAIAEAAATEADPTARRFYVDLDNHLHYFKGNEGLAAPYLIGDANYVATVRATSGLVSHWSMRESSGATAYDSTSDANDLTLSGNYTRNQASGVVNTREMASTLFGGTSSQAESTADADLHPGNTFSFECWYKRTSTSAGYFVSAGANDYSVRFNGSSQIVLRKEGVSDAYTTTSGYTDTTSWHHLVVTKTGATRAVYIDGAAVAASGTNETMVSAGATSIYIGETKVAASTRFTGYLQHVAIYSTALSAATVLAHYKDGMTVVADDFEFETDINDAGKHVYIRGGQAAGTGWVSNNTNSTYNQSFIIDRPQSTTAALKTAIGQGFLKRDAAPAHGGRAVVTGVDGWRAGQTLTIDNAALGIPSTGTWALPGTYTIMQLDTIPNLGNGVITYEIHFGVLPWSGSFDVQRKKKRSVANA